MPDTGTGTDPGTDRCWSCGHLAGVDCGCSCCCSGSDEERDAASEARYEQVYGPAVTDPVRGIYDLPIFGWAWAGDGADRGV